MTTFGQLQVAALACLVVLGFAATAQDAESFGPGHRYGQKEPSPRAKGSLRIASYNVLNYFDDVDDPALSGEWDDKDLTTSTDRLHGLAKTIRRLDADVLALQEVESEDAIIRFRDRYLKDMGYDYVASPDAGYYRGVEQSILSRVPITGVRNWPGLSTADVKRKGEGFQPVPEDPIEHFQRSPLMVDLKTKNGYEFTVFVVHLKAGGLAHAYRREAEGLKLVELVNGKLKTDPERNIFVIGDFNAKYSYKSMRVLFEGGLYDTMQHRGSEVYDSDTPLWITHESGRTLDYILVNPQAMMEVIPGSAFVLGTFYPGDSNHYNYRTDDPPKGYAADHYPVAIDIIAKD